jgi:uroporphyrinogen decarboxylase
MAQDFYPGRGVTWPLWMMRQAGRTLPEYRALRQKADSFIDLIRSPTLVKDITLQPLKRFDYDAAIVFSDILLPLAALPGVTLSFQNKSSPCVNFDGCSLDRLEDAVANMNNLPLYGVCEACSLISRELTQSQQLIGFCGGVWTVAAYIFGENSPLNWIDLLQKIEKTPPLIQDRWIDLLQALLVKTLVSQYLSGVTQVMIFDSWAGFAPQDLQKRWIADPIRKIIKSFQDQAPLCPVIYYSQGLGSLPVEWQLPASILACDRNFSIGQYQKSPYVFQGNCDPKWLFLSPKDCERNVEQWIRSLDQPVIINLSSGLDPLTPVENIEHFVKIVRKYTK